MIDVLFNPYRAVWLFVLFDLPVTTKVQRRRAATFRKDILREGFQMIQFSVYARCFGSLEAAKPNIRRVTSLVPPEGHVTIFYVTNKQYSMATVFHRACPKKDNHKTIDNFMRPGTELELF